MELWEALWLALKVPLAGASAELVAFPGKLIGVPDNLAAMLWNDFASCVGFFLWAWDSIAHSYLWISSYIGWAFYR